MRLPSALRIYRTRLDLSLALPALALVVIGSLVVYSATEYPDSARAGFFARHMLALPLAAAALALAMTLPLRFLDDFAYFLYAGALVLLSAVLIFGTEVYGAKRWLVLGPVRMQPAEIAKLFTVLALAHFLAAKRNSPGRIAPLALGLLMIGIPLILVLKEPDLGTSGAFAALGLGMLWWAGLPPLHLLVLASPVVGVVLLRHWILWGIFVVISVVVLWRSRMPWLVLILFLVVQISVFVGGPFLWDRLEPYQKARLTTFVEPEKDPAGAGYQLLQSKIAVGSGGMWGKGYLQGTQKALAFLPQQHTDFIFGVLGEEFGFLGALVTVTLFLTLVMRSFYIAVHCRNNFASLVAVGIGSLLLYHTIVNMAMSVGLMPVTGLPLPLVSYGGSFLVSVFAMIGLLLNISAHRFDY